MKKRALVLASGGARGAYQVGMLQELVVKRGLDFQIIRGVSVGALNAAFLAQAPTQRNSLAEVKKRRDPRDPSPRSTPRDLGIRKVRFRCGPIECPPK